MKQFTFTSQLAPIIWKYLESRQNEGYTSVHCGYYMQELDCLSKELSDAPVVTKELIDAWDLLKPYLCDAGDGRRAGDGGSRRRLCRYGAQQCHRRLYHRPAQNRNHQGSHSGRHVQKVRCPPRCDGRGCGYGAGQPEKNWCAGCLNLPWKKALRKMAF